VSVRGGPRLDPGQRHPGFARHASQWGDFSVLATDQVVSVEPAHWTLPPGRPPSDDELLCRLGGVDDVRLVGTGHPALMAGIWPSGQDAGLTGLGADYSVLFGRDTFTSLRALRPTYPVTLYPNLLLAVDEIVRYQGRTYEESIVPDHYEARGEAPGKLLHELRDPADPLAREISRVTSCGWPWFAGDDTTGEGVNFILEEALVNPAILERRVLQPDQRDVSYAEAVVAGLRWQLASMEASGHSLILSRRLRRPAGSTWMPPVGSAWRDGSDCYLRLDGTLPTRPVALLEVNAILYRSLRLAARMSEPNPEFGDLLGRIDLEQIADRVRAAIFDALWVDNGAGGFLGYFAELDEGGRRLEVAPVLGCGVIDALQSGLFDSPEMQERLFAVMRNLYDPAFGLRAPMGPRTLGRFSPQYAPSGGNGGICPHMNDKAADAAERLGFHQCARLDSRLVLHICESTGAAPECIRDAETPTIDAVRVRVWRAQPERHETSAIEPGKPWQLWSLAALVGSKARLARLERADLPPASPEIARLDAELNQIARSVVPDLPETLSLA
jgi:glycogen debranching enzyme